MKDNLKDANPANNFCAPHTLSNSGKQEMAVANYAEDFRKKFQNVVQYPGKARDLTRHIFYESILDSGGVILFVKYEKICQIATRGPKKTREGVLSVYNNKKSQRSR